MFKFLGKVALIVGVTCVCADGEATSITISGKVEVEVSSCVSFTRNASLENGASFKNRGVIMEETESSTYKIAHPTEGNTASIDNFADLVNGDLSKIGDGGVYYRTDDGFTGIKALTMPFLDEKLIDKTQIKSAGGWGNGSGSVDIGNTEGADGINLIMSSIASNYNASSASDCIYDFQGSPIDVGSRKNLLGDVSTVKIDTSDTAHQPAYDGSTAPCGIETGTRNTFHWPVNMGSKGGTSASTIAAMGGGIVRFEGDNSFYEIGTTKVVAGTTLLVTEAASMPQSDITVGDNSDSSGSKLTFPDDLSGVATFVVGSGKTLRTKAATSGSKTNIEVPNLAVLDAHAGIVNIEAGTIVTVKSGGKIVF